MGHVFLVAGEKSRRAGRVIQCLLKFLINWYIVTYAHILMAQASHIINLDSGMETFTLRKEKIAGHIVVASDG